MFPLYVPTDKSDNIFGLFRYVYVFARVWGYVPFSVNLNNVPLPDKVKVSLLNGLLLLIQLAVHVLCFVAIYNYDSENLKVRTNLITYGIHKANEFGILCGILFLMADVANRQNIWRIFRKFMHFDKEIMSTVSAFSIDYKKEKKSIKCYVTVWIIIIVVISIHAILVQLKFNPFFAVIFGYPILLVISGIYLNIFSIFSFLLHSVKIRFKVLNQSIRRSFEANPKIKKIKFIGDDFVDGTCDTIMMMAKLHAQLNDIVDDANSCYSIQVMLCFANIFAYLVLVLFSLYRIWFTTENIFENKEFLNATVLVAWTAFYLMLGICTIYLASSSLLEAQYTGAVIHECINVTHNHVIVERLLAFSQQLLHRTPDASCKLFSFDWKFFYSIIAATTTYLMILIQFDGSNNKAEYHCSATQIRNSTTP